METGITGSSRIFGLFAGASGFDRIHVLEHGVALPRKRHTATHERETGYAIYAGGARDEWFFVQPRPVAAALAIALRQAARFSVMGVFAATAEVKFNSASNGDQTTLTLGEDVTHELLGDSPELLDQFARGQNSKSVHWAQPRPRR